MFDPRTLSFSVGLGNLLFVVLVSLYLAHTQSRHPALEVWRWAKGVQASAFFLSVLASLFPGSLPPTLGSALHIAGASCELAAYAMLIGIRSWRRPLLIYAGIVLAVLLAVSWQESSQTPRLVIVSLGTSVPLLVIAALLLRATTRNRLTLLIALVNIGFGAILAARGVLGLSGTELVRFAPTVLNVTIYLMAYVVLVVNGFGFLLLILQQDEQTIARQLEAQRDAAHAQRQLLALASHEFRTPAAMIKTSLDSLRFLSEPIPSAVGSRLEQIRIAANRLTRLADTLISEDRLRHRNLTPDLAPHDLAGILEDACAAHPAGPRIEFVQPASPVWGRVDPDLLGIVLHNLIDNALAHNPAPDAWVRLAVTQDATHAELTVSDNGPGIAEPLRAQIFVPHRASRGGIAKGLGLSLCRGLLEAQQATIACTDHSPRGTTFRIRIPRILEPSVPPGGTPAPHSSRY